MACSRLSHKYRFFHGTPLNSLLALVIESNLGKKLSKRNVASYLEVIKDVWQLKDGWWNSVIVLSCLGLS